MQWSCVGCRKAYSGTQYTDCGCNRSNLVHTLPICQGNEHVDPCEHWGRCAKGKVGCTKADVCLSKLRRHLLKGGGCFDADNPKFGKFVPLPTGFQPTSGVGFLASCYLETGGTEIWHQTLLSRMSNVAGFVAMEPSLATGDGAKLGCPFGAGLQDARKLAESCHTLVVWGIGNRLSEVLNKLRNPPRVISVSHCDHRSQWTKDCMSAQGKYSEQCVYLCPTGIETVPAAHRDSAVMIPNAPDPARVKPTRSPAEIRNAYGFKPADKVLLVMSRISPEKRIDVLCDAVEHLPSDYRLVIVGPANGFASDYRTQIKNRADKSNGRIVLLDAVDSPADLLSISHAALSASTYEGYGLSMAEAILAGVPLIATQTGVLESKPLWAKLIPFDADGKLWAEAIAGDDGAERAVFAQRQIAKEHSVERFVEQWNALTSQAFVAGR